MSLVINKPHLAYTILGGFTSIFMLCSLFIKEKLYIGEATVATICGIIFGPVGAKLFDPNSWGNVDQITLECSRIVLVVQCFAVGVELPKKYMTRHWKSVVLLLVPVMTWGWLITSVVIWWMVPKLSWLESLVCAACVTATDPVLASSVVGKGKFAKRIPKHLRDLLSAESGCNDGMAFPFVYLSLYLIKYRGHPTEIFTHWFTLTVLYECIFGAIYGVVIGYAGRHAIKFAERKNLIDRESFLVFYFVLALWCAGTGSMLGLDDLLVGFCAGVAFSNDGWFAQRTEESHVSNVIDLLLNLAFFVYFGSIIPWSAYNHAALGITVWRLIVIAIFVVLFRRIPIMVALKPVIPDIKTWREALFAGHFGPIGVGAIFVAILARAELETGETTPLQTIPGPDHPNYDVIFLIWPITTFLVLSSIIVHGSSIAVFTLGKHINTMRITMSYTTANDDPNWLARLPRLTPRASMSIRKPDIDDSNSSEEKFNYPPGTLPPVGMPGVFLSRQRTEGREDSPLPSRPDSLRTRRPRKWDENGPGGPISDSAIAPIRTKSEPVDVQAAAQAVANAGTAEASQDSPENTTVNDYQEGSNIITETQDGEVVGKRKIPSAEDGPETKFGPFPIHPHEHHGSTPATVVDEKSALMAARAETSDKHRTRKPAWAYRFDDNIIVEDEDGEVIRRYKLPKEKRVTRPGTSDRKGSVTAWTSKMLAPFRSHASADDDANDDNSDAKTIHSMHEEHPNFRMHDEKGRRLSKQQFLQKLQKMDPHARATMAMSTEVSREMGDDDLATRLRQQTGATDFKGLPSFPRAPSQSSGESSKQGALTGSLEDRRSEVGFSNPFAQREKEKEKEKESKPQMQHSASAPVPAGSSKGKSTQDVETAAERRRREAALGIGEKNGESDSEEEDQGRLEQQRKRRTEIRFDERQVEDREQQSRALQWGVNVKGKGKGE
ncbi:sodium/hydrogen antiporter [Pyronema omphalodes]|nr:sodium/hydrogen antiporter [Pyronema omphalodes]